MGFSFGWLLEDGPVKVRVTSRVNDRPTLEVADSKAPEKLKRMQPSVGRH
jgi:hypothetical protein